MEKTSPEEGELVQYGSHYSENGFWGKAGNVAAKAGKKVIWMALVLYYVLKSPFVSKRNKTLIIGALGYFILPVDMIPDAIPALGFTDDLAALTIAFKAVAGSVTPEIEAQAQAKVDEWFK